MGALRLKFTQNGGIQDSIPCHLRTYWRRISRVCLTPTCRSHVLNPTPKTASIPNHSQRANLTMVKHAALAVSEVTLLSSLAPPVTPFWAHSGNSHYLFYVTMTSSSRNSFILPLLNNQRL